MRFAPLFEVRLTHAYYRDGRCPDFTVHPSAASERTLRNHRCLLRTRPDGLGVSIGLDDAGNPFLPLDPGTRFDFELRLTGDAFPRFTDLSGLDAASAPCWTNAGAASETGGELVLESLAGLPRGVFGQVRIELADGGDVAAPRAFEVAFPALESRWTYYCVTDLTAASGVLGIVDTSSEAAVVFGESGKTDLDATPDPDDRIGVQLPERYPGYRFLRFVSDAPVAARQAPAARLELQLDGVKLSGPLPTPSPRRSTRVGQETSLYQIVRYLTQPLS